MQWNHEPKAKCFLLFHLFWNFEIQLIDFICTQRPNAKWLSDVVHSKQKPIIERKEKSH